MTDAKMPEVAAHPRDAMQVPVVLTIRDINIILAVLGQKALADVISLFAKIQQQGNAAIADADRRDAEKQDAQGLQTALAADPVPEIDGVEKAPPPIETKPKKRDRRHDA